MVCRNSPYEESSAGSANSSDGNPHVSRPLGCPRLSLRELIAPIDHAGVVDDSHAGGREIRGQLVGTDGSCPARSKTSSIDSCSKSIATKLTSPIGRGSSGTCLRLSACVDG